MRGQLFWDTLSIIGAALVLILVTGVFAAWLLRRSLSPLRQLAMEAGQISAQKWNLEPLPRAERIIELRPLVQSLRTMVEGLRRSFDSQRDFIANAAHELKTPITIQKSTLQLLLHHGLTVDEYRTGLQQALRDTQRVEDLLQRLLKLARAEHGTTGTPIRHLEFVSLFSSCEAALIHMQPYAESRGVVLEMLGNGSARVRADMEDLVLIWSNLLENAIRYSPRDGHVVFTVDGCEQRMATVTVQDNGCGIEREQHERIFERFYRGDQSRARETGGVGLGLAMVKLLVERYGGTVHVDSDKDRGATFVVSLPLH
jgi:signal transduction histidine kinase